MQGLAHKITGLKLIEGSGLFVKKKDLFTAIKGYMGLNARLPIPKRKRP